MGVFGGSGIKSIQEGTATIASGNTTGTGSISAIDTDRSVVLFEGSLTAVNDMQAGLCRVYITNSTTITAERDYGPAFATTGGFMVVEYY